MNRKFLYTVSTFDSNQDSKDKYALVLERREESQVYVVLILSDDSKWMKADEGDYTDYNSAKVTLDELLKKSRCKYRN